jgi:hypothetical protein
LGINLFIVSIDYQVSVFLSQTHLSPAIRGRFRTGLDVGVRSLLPACSNSSNALLTADESTGSECRSVIADAPAVCVLFDLSVGGVLLSGGDISEGVMGMPSAVRLDVDIGARRLESMIARREILCAENRVGDWEVSQ